ncbi:putative Cyclic nucleotide-binding protein [Sterolibacterium denitrificans]|uniref:Cyclic nucleotide-binding protein n=2 Tax=Sterolibacterium denitrificans TaxID=157592 RepID=A0A7Z7MVG4_9PROT|nr:putative Cyclic nucleotide-binding protein [Sterolibacterium denitrificans]
MKIREILNGMPLFSGLSAEQLEMLAHASHKMRFGKAQTLLRAGHVPDALYHVLAGHLKRTVTSGSGEKVLDLVFPGQSFGEAELLAERPSVSDAVAIEPGLLLCIDARALREVVRTSQPLALRLLANLAQRQIDTETDVLASRSLNGCQRSLDYLILQAGGLSGARGETRLVLPTSKQLIAARLGLTPETFSRSLRELFDAGLIVVDGRHILLQNERIIRNLLGHAGGHAQDWSHDCNRPHALRNVVLPGDARLPHRVSQGTTNKAARLRMLSQRMAKSWLMLGRNVLPQRARSMLNQSVDEFEQQLGELAGLSVSKEVRAAHGTVLALWQSYKVLLDSPPTPQNARKLFSLNEKVLSAAHHLMLAFEDSTNAHDDRLLALASRGRLLSQRMAKFYMFLEWKPYGISSSKCQDELRHAMQEFETGLALLIEEVRDHPQIRSQIDHAMRQWHFMRSALSDAEHDAPDHLTATVCTFSERLLKKMDTAIALYEKKQAA